MRSASPDPGRRIRWEIDADGAGPVSQYLNMRMSHADGCAVAWLGGELDVAEAAESRAFLLTALDDGRGRLVVEVTGLTFIDASGLGVLVLVARKAAQDDGGWLRLVGASLLLRRILSIARLSAFLPVYDTVHAAVAGAPATAAPRPRPRQGSDL